MTITTHLILVSAQPIPNLTPVLDERFKPRKVVMLVSKDMQERGNALENIYKPRGIEVERCLIDDPWDVGQITDQLLILLDNYDEGSIALNATGGTKLMSIAAFDVFRSCKQPIFYVHPEQDRLIWLHSGQPPIDLADRIKLKDYLMAYGVSRVEIPSPYGVSETIRKLGQSIVASIDRLAGDLAILNYLAYQAENKLSAEITEGPQSRPGLWELLDLFADAGFCDINGHRLCFKNESARFLANGGWLEQYTYALCLNLKTTTSLQDIACNVTIHRQPMGAVAVKNELDVAVISNNRLHLVECKTQRYNEMDGKDADVLYKLDSLRDLIGGLQGRAMLVSFNQLGKAARARAKELNIHYCCGTELKNLQSRLQDWLTKKS